MTEILLPVGQPLGVMGDPTAGPDGAVASVRIADEWVELTPAQYRLWLLAFQHADRAALGQAASSAGLTDVPAAVDGFLGRGLLVAFDPAADVRALLDGHCLLPAGFGLGSSASQPGYFEIAGPDLQPRVRVELDVYLAWGNAHRTSIWTSCETIADEQNLELPAVAAHVAMNLPALTSTGTAFLDQWS